MATTSYNYQQIAAAFIVKNNRQGVIDVLVSNNLVANATVANLMTDAQLARILYNYYLKNGAVAYAGLLKQIPVRTDVPAGEKAEVESLASQLDITPPQGEAFRSSFQDVFNSVWTALVGKSETVTTPVVTVEEKASPLTIGLVIGGVAILAIIAWVVVKY